jgi:outer membrane protein
VVGLLLLGIGGAGAQEIPQVLTLGDALAIARDRNPAYRRAVAQAEATGADVRASFGAFLPNLNANLSWNGNSRTTITGEDDFGRPIELPEAFTFRSSSASQGLSSSITLFDGLQNLNALRASEAGRDAADEGVDWQEMTVDAEVTRRFYTALQARRLIEVEEQVLDVTRQQLEATERLYRVAARSEVDVLGAQSNVANAEQQLARAQADERKAVLRLAEQIGLDEGVALDVEGTLPPVFDPSALDADSLVSWALAENPRIGQAAANASQAEYSASAARGRRWPVLSARASFGRNVGLSSYEALWEFNPTNRSFSFGVDVQIPLFTRFQTSNAIAQATATERVAQENLRETQLQLERDVRSAHIDLLTAYRNLELAQQSVDFSRRRLAMAQEQYQLGTIDFTNFQQVVTSASNDARSLINAELEFARATVSLEELVGTRVRP